jgi:hypothetical protein
MADQTEQSSGMGNPITPTKQEAPQDLRAMKEAQDAAWKTDTLHRLTKGQRHPVKVKKHPTEEGKLDVDGIGHEIWLNLYESTGLADIDAGHKLFNQTIHAQPDNGDVFAINSAAAMLNALAPESPLEGLLCSQMVSAHNMAAEFSHRAMMSGQTEEGIERNINRASKLMKLFTAQTEALHKLRNKGQQRIIVQHVQVNEGGQAVIGDINPAGEGRG